ncbi:MAG: LL-diaminopimelate aminotransferase [Lachnospiraceae bacterium]|nr:LL-diaminopimelate aminotransferase [Lachnospiraceae bacterium]
MLQINENYLNLKQNYLFSEVAQRTNKYINEHPDKPIIRLGIGDVTKPLTKKTIEALHDAADHMSKTETFKGYGPEQGYDFLRNAVVDYYKKNNVDIEMKEVFISDGAKSDTGNITDLFGPDNIVLIPDPVYPVYMDTNIMNGRNIRFMDANKENGFTPMPYDGLEADIIYICSPNNPTGAAYTREQLKVWVDFALEHNSLILFDAAYECFIEDDTPHSIFEIEGAKKCAIEFCSLSKTAGFTGTRCGYTIVPLELVFKTSNGSEMSLNSMWTRRQTTKFNGVPYVIQYAAAATLSEEGIKECKENIAYYKENARIIASVFEKKGITYFGGKNSPYIWFECPNGMESWDFFDYMLNEIQVVGTPGAGFGANGNNFFRLTAFGSRENTIEAVNRIDKLLS